MASDEVTMTLWFTRRRPESMQNKVKFLDLCRRRGLHGTIKSEEFCDRVRVTLKNATEKRKLMSAWSSMTCEVIDVNPRRQRTFDFKKTLS